MKSKKILSLVIAMSVVSSMLVGCGSSKEKAKEDDGPVKISMTLMDGPKKPNTWFQEELNKKLNAQFEFIMLPGWEEKNTKTNLLMQDKDKMPDVLWFNGMAKEYKQWTEAGLLVDVLPLLKNTKNKNMLKKFTAEQLFPYYEDGKMYKIPTGISQTGCTMSTFVRKDWL